MDSLDTLAADPRWESLFATYDDLVRVSENWPISPGTPPGVTRLLTVCRHLFRHSWFVYDFLMIAAVQSLIAIEAALRDRLDEQPRRRGPTMWNLVEQAVSQGLIRQERAENVLAAVELRNSWLHVSGQKVISPGVAEQVIAESHAVIANLYTDRAGAASDAVE